MRQYEFRMGVEVEVDGGVTEPTYEETIDAVTDDDAIELAKASMLRAAAGPGMMAQLLDDAGLVIWQRRLARKADWPS